MSLQKKTKKLQPRIEPGLEQLTLSLTSTLPSQHDSKKEKFDYPILISHLLVIESTPYVLVPTLVQIGLKSLIFLLVPVSGVTTRATFVSFQLVQTLL